MNKYFKYGILGLFLIFSSIFVLGDSITSFPIYLTQTVWTDASSTYPPDCTDGYYSYGLYVNGSWKCTPDTNESVRLTNVNQSLFSYLNHTNYTLTNNITWLTTNISFVNLYAVNSNISLSTNLTSVNLYAVNSNISTNARISTLPITGIYWTNVNDSLIPDTNATYNISSYDSWIRILWANESFFNEIYRKGVALWTNITGINTLLINVNTSLTNNLTSVNKYCIDSNISTSTYITNVNSSLSTYITNVNKTNPWNRTGTNIFPISLGDNIGIGTNNPSKPLEIIGELNVTTNISIGGGLIQWNGSTVIISVT